MEQSWNRSIGNVIASIGTPQFAGDLVSALRGLVPFDYSVMFAYCGDARPLDLYDDFPANKRRVFVTMYQEGPYLLDPFFLAGTRMVDPDLYRLKDLAPDRFYQSEYFRSYYVQTGLSEEIGYFVVLPGSVMAVVSLMRADHSPVFGAREFRELQAAEPIVRAAAGQHWNELHRRFSGGEADGGPSNIQRHIDHAFRTFGKSVLTPTGTRRGGIRPQGTLVGSDRQDPGDLLGHRAHPPQEHLFEAGDQLSRRAVLAIHPRAYKRSRRLMKRREAGGRASCRKDVSSRAAP